MNITTIAKRLSLLVLFIAPTAGWAAESMVPAPPQLAAKSYVLMDGESGQVLVENNGDQRLPPASLTKLMTAYIATKEIEAAASARTTWSPSANMPGAPAVRGCSSRSAARYR